MYYDVGTKSLKNEPYKYRYLIVDSKSNIFSQ